MKCQILFPGRNKKNISICLLKSLLSVLSVKEKWCMLCHQFDSASVIQRQYFHSVFSSKAS